jgi:hypothetical protein
MFAATGAIASAPQRKRVAAAVLASQGAIKAEKRVGPPAVTPANIAAMPSGVKKI